MSNNNHEATTPEDRNWTGGLVQPNGDQSHTCSGCGLTYRGFSRRDLCRACYNLKVHFPSIFVKKSNS